MDVVRSKQGQTLDEICFQHYGSAYEAGVTEQAYQANPGLCELGPILPINTPVNLPLLEIKKPEREVVNLWD